MTRTLTTPADLAALPVGSVVRDGLGGIFEAMESDLRWPDSPLPPVRWYRPGWTDPDPDGRPLVSNAAPGFLLWPTSPDAETEGE